MTAHVLISGQLFREPEQRTSKAGKPFVTCTVRTKDGDTSTYWSLVAFSESVQAELMRLTAGESLSVQGGMQIGEYEKDGIRKPSFSVIADHVLALRQPSKRAGAGKDAPTRQAEPSPGPFEGDVPF
jgi:single-stranded DNA-binding protein